MVAGSLADQLVGQTAGPSAEWRNGLGWTGQETAEDKQLEQQQEPSPDPELYCLCSNPRYVTWANLYFLCKWE